MTTRPWGGRGQWFCDDGIKQTLSLKSLIDYGGRGSPKLSAIAWRHLLTPPSYFASFSHSMRSCSSSNYNNDKWKFVTRESCSSSQSSSSTQFLGALNSKRRKWRENEERANATRFTVEKVQVCGAGDALSLSLSLFLLTFGFVFSLNFPPMWKVL